MTNFTMIPNHITRNPSFNVYEKAVLLYLMSLSPDRTTTMLSIEAATGMSELTLRKTIRRLVEDWVIAPYTHRVRPVSDWRLDDRAARVQTVRDRVAAKQRRRNVRRPTGETE